MFVRACTCVYVCAGTQMCVRQTDRHTDRVAAAIIVYFSLNYVISAVTVECIMKGMRPAMQRFYSIDCDSSYVFRLCNVAIIGLLISEVCMYVCMCVCIYIYIYTHIQGVPGGMCQTSGECSLC